jgi:glycine cleavage system H protein
MASPNDRRYSQEHEWVLVDGDVGTVGITDFAQDELGDVVYIDVPAAGAKVSQFQKFGEIESVKAVSDLFSPVSGEVVERNEAAVDAPELVNSEPFAGGWLVKVRLSDPSELEKLMDAAAYDKMTAESSGH